MAYQPDPSYAANQQTYGYPAARYYPQVVIGPSPSQVYQQQNYAAYQAQNSLYVPAGIHQQHQQQQYPPPTFDIKSALPPTPSSVSNVRRESDDARRKRPTPSEPPLDYQVLLLSLAEEYFNAAHAQGSLVALVQRGMEMESYYKLVATGLGCLETVLKVGQRAVRSLDGCSSLRAEYSTALEVTTTVGSNSPVKVCQYTPRGDGQLYGSRNGIEYRGRCRSVRRQ